jgi:hypothetical protein
MSATSNPPAASTANAQYKLWCIVEGQEAPFSVTVPATSMIDDLQNLIKEKGKDASASDLVLWKVSTLYTLMSPLK